MSSDKDIREQLIALLQGGNAHMSFNDAVADFPPDKMNELFPNGTYTPWHLLEHIRITQLDILDFIRNPDYQEISWPDDYWSKKNAKASQKDWDKTIKEFNADLKELIKMVKDDKNDLDAKILWGNGQNFIREILLVADHSAYHIGEFAIMRQVMNTWLKGHK